MSEPTREQQLELQRNSWIREVDRLRRVVEESRVTAADRQRVIQIHEQRIAELEELVCAIWQCPPDELGEHDHEATVAEANRQARRIAELEAENARLRAEIEIRKSLEWKRKQGYLDESEVGDE